MSASFKGKVALVTGSTSGIGLAIARAYAAEGAVICINGFGDAAAIEKERSDIEKDFGVKAIYSGADMSKGDQTQAMVTDAIKQLGAVDILVNNAGIQFVSPVEELPPEKWEQILAINLSSAFYASRAAIPGMKAKKWGRIINTASAHALIASPFKSAYVAAKHGIAGFTKTVALETATFGITANAICPGYIDTPLLAPFDDAIRGLILMRIGTNRLGRAEEIAELVRFLAGAESSYCTGEIITASGGYA